IVHHGLEVAAVGARSLLQAAILRAMVSARPGSVRLTLIDAAGSGANLAPFLRLPDALRGEKVYTRPDEIERRLNELTAHVEHVVQTRLLNIYASIAEYNERTTGQPVPYEVLVLEEFPAGWNDQQVEQLATLARTG